MLAWMRARPAIIALVAVTLALSACQTNQQTGTLVGAGAGAAIGSRFGSGSGKVGAMLLGAIIGAVAGSAIGQSLDEADRRKADEAAQRAVADPSSGRVAWSSDKNPQVRGYAEPLPPANEVSAQQVYCLDVQRDQAYRLNRARCVGADQPIGADEFEKRRQLASSPLPVSAPGSLPQATPMLQPVSDGGSCRHVREVVVVNGSETKNDVEYCLKAGQWTRA